MDVSLCRMKKGPGMALDSEIKTTTRKGESPKGDFSFKQTIKKESAIRRISNRPSKQDVREIGHIADNLPGKFGTPAERKIIACKMLPKSRFWNTRQKCQAIQVSPDTWYAAHKKPKFHENCVAASQFVMGSFIPDVLMAHIDSALDGNVQAQIRFLEENKVYEKQKGGDTNVNVGIRLTIEQQQQIAKQREEKRRNALEKYGFIRVPDVSPN